MSAHRPSVRRLPSTGAAVGRVPTHGAAPTGRKKVAHRPSAIGDPAKPPTALGHESQNTSSPEGAKEGGISTLKEIVQPRRGKSSPADHPDLPYIGLEHVEAHTTRLLGSVPATEMRSTANRFQPGDVLYSRLRPYLNKVWRADREGLCSSEFIVLPGNERVDSSYLCYRLNAHDFVSFANSLNAGDRPRVDFDQISTFQTWLPRTLPEQRRIVAEIEKQFTRLEAGVAALRRVQANLKRYRAAVLKAACEGRLVPAETELVGRLPSAGVGRVPSRGDRAKAKGNAGSGDPAYNDAPFETGEALLARILTERRQNWQGRGQYKEPAAPDTTSLQKLPEGWTWATAEQLTDENRSITYGVIKLGAPVADGVHVLRSSDVRHLRLDLEDVKRVSPDIAGEYRRTFLKGGEVLITVRGTLGGVVVAPAECAGFNISREVAMLAMVEPAVAKIAAIFIGSAPLQRWLLQRAEVLPNV